MHQFIIESWSFRWYISNSRCRVLSRRYSNIVFLQQQTSFLYMENAQYELNFPAKLNKLNTVFDLEKLNAVVSMIYEYIINCFLRIEFIDFCFIISLLFYYLLLIICLVSFVLYFCLPICKVGIVSRPTCFSVFRT